MLHSLLLLPVLALAEEPVPLTPGVDLFAGVELDAASRYLWRGMYSSEGPTLQPSVWFGVGAVSLSAWSNVNLTSLDSQRLSELDLQLSLSQSHEAFTFDPALVLYLFPGQPDEDPTGELLADFGWQPEVFGLYSSHAVDFWNGRPGWWSETGARVDVAPTEALSLGANLGISLGNKAFNEYYLEADRYGMQYLAFGAEAGWALPGGLAVGLTGTVDFLPLDPVQQALECGPVVGAALLSVSWEGGGRVKRTP
jgi:hypothetical protein